MTAARLRTSQAECAGSQNPLVLWQNTHRSNFREPQTVRVMYRVPTGALRDSRVYNESQAEKARSRLLAL
jgi:hypothetical protein